MRRSLYKGFTLIEVIVSVAIFSIVMVIAIGAVLSAVNANRKAQSINVVVNNLNLAVESMVRDIRTGSNYSDCSNGGNSDCIRFTDRDGNIGVTYSLITSGSNTYLEKGPLTQFGSGRITSDEVGIDVAEFWIKGEGPDGEPERLLVHLKGHAGSNTTKSEFNIQTLVTSRALDADEFDQ